MSDASQGPGWWVASDGKWYPPEHHPDRATPDQTNPSAASPPPTDPATTEVSGGPGPDPFAPQPATRRGPRPAVVVVAAVVVLALLAGAFVLLSGGDDKADDTTQVEVSGAASDARSEDGSSSGATTDVTTAADDTPSAEVPAGTVLVTPSLVGSGLESLDDATMIGVDYELTISESVRTDTLPADGQLLDELGLAPEPTYDYGPTTATTLPIGRIVPAEGEQLVVVRYDLSSNNTYAELSAAIDVDGTKHSVELLEGSNTLIATVDAGADRVSIAVQDTDSNQSIDVIDGTLDDDHPRILYVDQPDRRAAINDTMLLPFTATSPNGGDNQEGDLEIGVGEIELAWSTTQSSLLGEASSAPTLRPPTDAGHAWLILEIDRFAAVNNYLPDLSPSQVVLVLDDGTEIESQHGIEDWLAFEVPFDTTAASLRVEPGDGVQDRQGYLTYNFGGYVGEIDLTIGRAGSADETTTTTEP